MTFDCEEMKVDIFMMLLAVSALALSSGCRSLCRFESHYEVLNIKAFIAVADGATATLSAVREKDTARRLLPKLQDVRRRFTVLRETVDAYPPEGDAEYDRAVVYAMKVYGPQFNDAECRVLDQLERLRNLPGVPEVLGREYFLRETWGFRVSYQSRSGNGLKPPPAPR